MISGEPNTDNVYDGNHGCARQQTVFRYNPPYHLKRTPRPAARPSAANHNQAPWKDGKKKRNKSHLTLSDVRNFVHFSNGPRLPQPFFHGCRPRRTFRFEFFRFRRLCEKFAHIRFSRAHVLYSSAFPLNGILGPDRGFYC